MTVEEGTLSRVDWLRIEFGLSEQAASTIEWAFTKVEEEARKQIEPIDMRLFCERCHAQHIDKPQPEKDWTNPPHRSHECQACGWVWRPADVPTNGVEDIKTKGQRDSIALDWPA